MGAEQTKVSRADNLDRAFNAVREFAERVERIPFVKIAKNMNMPESTLYNYIYSLVSAGRLVRTGVGTYAIGDGNPEVKIRDAHANLYGPVPHRPMPDEPPALKGCRDQIMAGRAYVRRRT